MGNQTFLEVVPWGHVTFLKKLQLEYSVKFKKRKESFRIDDDATAAGLRAAVMSWNCFDGIEEDQISFRFHGDTVPEGP
jgi:uncharacterized membrane protein YjfL (UPF0719 family)